MNFVFLIRPVLKEAWLAGETHFVLDCSVENLHEILIQAQQIGLMTNKHHYIITNVDLQTIDIVPFQFSETNITGVGDYRPETLKHITNNNNKHCRFVYPIMKTKK